MRVVAVMGLCAGLALVAGSADAAFPGRNGMIVFVRETHGSSLDARSAIYVVNPDYTGLKALTDPKEGAFDTSPTWSPDGRRIAFVRLVGHVSHVGDAHEIFVMQLDGRAQKRLTHNAVDDESPAWSPDGKRIVFARQTRTGPAIAAFSFDIWIMRADGSGARRLTDGGADEVQPAWSPDGKQIAYLVDNPHSPGARISVMDANGKHSRVVAGVPLPGVTREEALAHQRPSWSPDGTRLAFVGWKGITIVRIRDGAKTVLPVGLHPSWSPDGTRLTFTRLDPQSSIGQIYVMDATGGNLRALTSAHYPLDDNEPDWQPVQARVPDRLGRSG